MDLDARQPPPKDLREIFKKLQRSSSTDLSEVNNVVDFNRNQSEAEREDLRVVSSINRSRVRLCPSPQLDKDSRGIATPEMADVFEPASLPGLYLIPGLLSPDTQVTLLSRLLHRDLADPRHFTNLHKHYKVPYDQITPSAVYGESPRGSSTVIDADAAMSYSFFSIAPSASCVLQPHDSAVHKQLTVGQFLNKKLRWITLGGQYDWTRKEYPKERPPTFPPDVSDLVRNAFPDMKPEAAIVNVYSPGDTLSLHRDVSEASGQGLVSISIGCEAIFLVGIDDGIKSKYLAVRLRSGDAVYMSGASRYAWHGIPRIIPNSCPSWLAAWPAVPSLHATADQHCSSADNLNGSSAFEHWRDWMASKRINLNVRQMFDSAQSNPTSELFPCNNT